jgi:hypothetical protein
LRIDSRKILKKTRQKVLKKITRRRNKERKKEREMERAVRDNELLEHAEFQRQLKFQATKSFSFI